MKVERLIDRIKSGESASHALREESDDEAVPELDVEVLTTSEGRRTGYRDRSEPGDGEGLLFLHESDQRMLRYTMEGVEFPLDIIFASGREVTAMARSVQPGRSSVDGVGEYVIETRAGWASENGIEVGTNVAIDRDGDRATVRFGEDSDTELMEDETKAVRLDEQVEEIVDIVQPFTDLSPAEIEAAVRGILRASKQVGIGRIMAILRNLRTVI